MSGAPDKQAGRSCAELGVCRSAVPCTVCAHPFAPGAVERHARPFCTPAQRRELGRWLRLALLAMALVGGVALAAGFVAGLLRGGL